MENKEPRVSQDGLSREKMLERIYEVMADKTLSFWCKFSTRYWKPNDDSQLDDMTDSKKLYSIIQNYQIDTVDGPYESLPYFIEIWGELENTNDYWRKYKHLNYEIIWHPVMIGDVLNRAENRSKVDKSFLTKFTICSCYICGIWIELHNLLSKRSNKTEPVEKQPIDLIKNVYSLIGKHKKL